MCFHPPHHPHPQLLPATAANIRSRLLLYFYFIFFLFALFYFIYKKIFFFLHRTAITIGQWPVDGEGGRGLLSSLEIRTDRNFRSACLLNKSFEEFCWALFVLASGCHCSALIGRRQCYWIGLRRLIYAAVVMRDIHSLYHTQPDVFYICSSVCPQ